MATDMHAKFSPNIQFPLSRLEGCSLDLYWLRRDILTDLLLMGNKVNKMFTLSFRIYFATYVDFY